MSAEILIVYHSQYGATAQLAKVIARGVESVTGASAKLRAVPTVSAVCEQIAPSVPEEGEIYATSADLVHCDGLILGSPTHFGNMSAELKYFLDQSSKQWLQGDLIGKPAAVFTATGSFHGGQESTLLTMMLPLLHHGMVVVGLPYSEPALNQTSTGGSPYGASHVSVARTNQLSQHEHQLAMALGARVASVALKLKA